MTWTLLILFSLLSAVLAVSRRTSLSLPQPRSPRFTTTGVEGVRKLRKETKAALNAATALLR